MKKLLATLFVLLFAIAGFAQQQLCLPKGPAPYSIDFKADEVDNFLHGKKYKAFLIGEMHNGLFSPDMQYHLITYLNKYYGIRHVFTEMSVSCAWHFNRYLQTGDTTYYTRIPAVAAYQQWPTYWKRLYDYNQTLPEGSKIVIHGLDFERTEVFPTIMELAPQGQTPPQSLKAVMDTVAAHVHDKPLSMYRMLNGRFIEFDNSGFVTTLRYIQKQFLQHSADAKAYFGNNYPVIEDIARNNGNVEVRPKPRNRTMFSTMRRIIKEQNIQKFVGVFGAEHTSYANLSSIGNAIDRLPGYRKQDVLNIHEVVYNLRKNSKGEFENPVAGIMQLNAGCKATILPARRVQGYRHRADFVIVGDALP